MSRVIFVPQYPAKMRYQEWWIKDFKLKFSQNFKECHTLGLDYLEKKENQRSSSEMFSPIQEAIEFEMAQMAEYINLEIRNDDILFLADISFPGLFTDILFHKQCPKMFAFCHATSMNAYDYFQPVRKYKKKAEALTASMFDGVFFGSYYAERKVGWNRYTKTYITRLPTPPFHLIYDTPTEKDIKVVSVCRPSIQKVNKKLEKRVERAVGKIHRQDVNSWGEYTKLLNRSKILLISTKEDTFNYTIMDAIFANCIPLAPNKLCFPEILEKEYLYDGPEDLIYKIENILANGGKVPLMKCHKEVHDFYDVICEIMSR